MLSVIGVGYPRTGTMSLKYALEQLALGPCYHMIEVFDRPQDVDFWTDALASVRSTISWDKVFQDFNSTADCPACYFWPQLFANFSDAKFILTLRDPEVWYNSFRATVYEATTHPERAPDEEHRRVQVMAKKLILDQMLEGRAEDRQFAIDKYQQHNDAIIKSIPADQLLVFDVSEGWQPLCRFLGVAVPDTPFPRANTRVEFQERFAIKSD